MAFKLSTSVILLLPIYLTFCSAASAVDCSTIVLNMADCLSFVQSGSTVEKPEGSCCSGLKTVLKTGPQCLCEAYKSSASMGITLDVTKALSLPHACNIVAPSAAKCGMSLPTAAAAAPDASSPEFAATAPKSSMETVSEAPAPAPGAVQAASSPSFSIWSGSSLTIAFFIALFCGF